MSGCTMTCSIRVPGDDLQGDETLKPSCFESMQEQDLEVAPKG